MVLAVDGGESPAWTVLAPLTSGAALGVGLAAALNPAVVLGLATAGIVSWTTDGIAAGVGLVDAVAGAYIIDVMTPADASAE